MVRGSTAERILARPDLAAVVEATAALQANIDRASARGGGRVSVAAGVREVGSLRLRSGVELHLERGAVLRFVPEPELYPAIDARWEGRAQRVHAPCLWASDACDIALTGHGTIDGGGPAWWRTFRTSPAALAYPRPTLVGLHGCTRVTVSDVTLLNSPAWTLHPLLCRDVRITGIRILNPPDSPNTDGIDPESCSGVRISDCHIDVGDDCIAIKAGAEGSSDPVACENIAISNCTMVHGHGGVVIGSEMSGGVRGVVVTGCVFQGTDRGIRIKTRRRRGGTVEDVRVAHVVMDDVSCPLVINPFYFCGEEGKLPHVADRAPHPVDAGTPRIRRIHIAHVTATNARAAAGWVSGLPEAPLEDLVLDDVVVTFAHRSVAEVPAMADGVPAMARRGLHAQFATGVRLRGVRILDPEGPELVLDERTVRLAEAATP
ncbi:glycoside hydrolase family 28 protein [Microbacterium excoecariae]|uniref:glycoside hydrolase family 28 protein n=1 Tax=Microbacterium excoecariae TaxID=2715210 RepID=UPI00140A8AAD|nr:glycoside hydrolase family 28 protein [Microbacterium excoecariae]NHI17396.1 glycoside hydrolase family 28 protein [Microbacterium excoecariae]